MVPPSLEKLCATLTHRGYGSTSSPIGRHDPIPYSLLTVETPAESTWPHGRSVRDSQVHSALSTASAHTLPDSLGHVGRLLVLFTVAHYSVVGSICALLNRVKYLRGQVQMPVKPPPPGCA